MRLAPVAQRRALVRRSMPPTTRRSNAFILWAAPALVFGVCVLSYLLAPVVPTGHRDWVALPLYPGVSVYSAVNGSLLFGAGFGQVGNLLLIVGCSGLFWLGLLAAMVALLRGRAGSKGSR